MDTTRADHLSLHGYARDTSPRLIALAADGVRFDTAYAPSATTGPSHASLFTGLYPMAHGVVKNGYLLAAEHTTLAEQLLQEGYDTAAVVSSYVLSARFGYDQGFVHFDADFSQAKVPSGTALWEGEAIEGKFYGSADDTTRRALEWIDARPHPERPFLLFVHYFDPHDPYRPPPGFQPPFESGPKEQLKLNRTILRYDTLLAFTDREIGRLVDELDARVSPGSTLLVVTGDHGEGLMQHGHMFHGVHLYDEAVRVPLVVRWPGRIDAGQVVSAPVQIQDLAATILRLIGIGTPGVKGVTGAFGEKRGLRAPTIAQLLGEDTAADGERPVHLYRRRYAGGEVAEGVHARGEQFGLRLGRWKLIDAPEEETVELYDLEVDPQEQHDLARSEPERVESMREHLQQWRRENTRAGAAAPPLSDEERARLEALGYVD
jgi:arylsulfatase A-like enzyme